MDSQRELCHIFKPEVPLSTVYLSVDYEFKAILFCNITQDQFLFVEVCLILKTCHSFEEFKITFC